MRNNNISNTSTDNGERGDGPTIAQGVVVIGSAAAVVALHFAGADIAAVAAAAGAYTGSVAAMLAAVVIPRRR